MKPERPLEALLGIISNENFCFYMQIYVLNCTVGTTAQDSKFSSEKGIHNFISVGSSEPDNDVVSNVEKRISPSIPLIIRTRKSDWR